MRKVKTDRGAAVYGLWEAAERRYEPWKDVHSCWA